MTSAPANRSLRRLGASVALAALAVFSFSTVAGAYGGAGGTGAVTSGCSSTTSGSNCTFTFSFQNSSGAPECNVTVNFTTSGVPGSSIQPSQGTTNCNGQVQAVFEAGSGCGTATITAATSDATAQTTDKVPCPGGGLPNTSTLPPTPSPWWAGLAAFAALLVAGGGIALRRMRVTA